MWVFKSTDLSGHCLRKVEESYDHKRVGTLPEHPLEGSTILELLEAT